jgi:hypothetical protein
MEPRMDLSTTFLHNWRSTRRTEVNSDLQAAEAESDLTRYNGLKKIVIIPYIYGQILYTM